MSAITLLIICLAAQALIVAALGVFFLRRYLHQRRAKQNPRPPQPSPPGH